jgi:osmotically-inducible protein OsmY
MGATGKDIEIRAEVLRQIDREQIADCGELRVRVHRGRITLAGWVQTEAQKILAEAPAESVAGGRQVINRIRVPGAARRRRDLALAERIEQCLAANAPPAEAIRVSVLNGVAKLSGCVDFDSERRGAETEVLCLPGLSGMRSRISVRAPQPAAPPSMAQADLMGKALGG